MKPSGPLDASVVQADPPIDARKLVTQLAFRFGSKPEGLVHKPLSPAQVLRIGMIGERLTAMLHVHHHQM